MCDAIHFHSRRICHIPSISFFVWLFIQLNWTNESVISSFSWIIIIIISFVGFFLIKCICKKHWRVRLKFMISHNNIDYDAAVKRIAKRIMWQTQQHAMREVKHKFFFDEISSDSILFGKFVKFSHFSKFISLSTSKKYPKIDKKHFNQS